MRTVLVKKILTLLLVCGAGWGARAQSHEEYHDYRKFHFGAQIALNFADVRLVSGNFPIVNPITGARLNGIVTVSQPGLTIGLILNKRISKNVDLRFIPAVSLTQRNFEYIYRDSVGKRKIEASYLDLPLYVKVKSQVYNNHAVYVMTGPKLSYNMTSDRRVQTDPSLLKIEKLDFGWTFAFGIHLYGDLVKLSPEIAYTAGLVNVYVPFNEDFPGAVQQMFTHQLTLSILFE